MKRRESDNCVRFLREKEQEQWDEDSENRNKKGGHERLDHFRLPLVLVQVAFLQKNMRVTVWMPRGDRRTKVGQKAEMFWMETRPTKSDIGKTQKMVEAL